MGSVPKFSSACILLSFSGSLCISPVKMKFMRNGMNMVDLAAIIPFILTVILETMDDIVIIGETACTLIKKKRKFSSYTVKK
jgi:hypothetical protein